MRPGRAAAGASWLGTALVSEALALRAAGVGGPVLALIATPGADWSAAIEHDVDVSVGSVWALTEVADAARALGRTARVHLETDTGLSRGGAGAMDWADLFAAAARGQAEGSITVVSVWSHLACADLPGHHSTARAEAGYRYALAAAARAGLTPALRHLANSAATFALPDTRFDLVRTGIAMYGLSPGEQVGTAEQLGLRPVMTLAARLALAKRVPAGEGVSYGQEHVTSRDTVLGVVPVGYGDGLLRAASGAGPVRVSGRPATVVGRVCMDQVVVDLGPGSDAVAGDLVVLFGDPATGAPSAEDWAAVAGTIGYEVVTRLGPRVPRVHVRGGT